jgi:hypothetical protein
MTSMKLPAASSVISTIELPQMTAADPRPSTRFAVSTAHLAYIAHTLTLPHRRE